jgi:hypothetical protein
MNFLILYFANLVLDYPLQGEFLATFKTKNNYILWVHSAIWGIGIALALNYLGLFAWWKVAFLVGGHIVIDYWKCRGCYKKYMGDWAALYVDQALHVVQLILVLF